MIQLVHYTLHAARRASLPLHHSKIHDHHVFKLWIHKNGLRRNKIIYFDRYATTNPNRKWQFDLRDSGDGALEERIEWENKLNRAVVYDVGPGTHVTAMKITKTVIFTLKLEIIVN